MGCVHMCVVGVGTVCVHRVHMCTYMHICPCIYNVCMMCGFSPGLNTGLSRSFSLLF